MQQQLLQGRVSRFRGHPALIVAQVLLRNDGNDSLERKRSVGKLVFLQFITAGLFRLRIASRPQASFKPARSSQSDGNNTIVENNNETPKRRSELPPIGNSPPQ